MFKRFKLLTLLISVFTLACSNAGNSSNSNDHPIDKRTRITQEEGVNVALSTLEYTFFEYGYESSEGIASNGEEEYAGIIYSDFSSYVQDEEGNCYFEAGFFQTIPSVESTEHLLTPEKIDEEKPLIAVDGEGLQFVITKSIVNFKSFSFIIDDWYNVIKRVGEMILEVKSFENDRQYYDYDVSCFSYDTNQWLFKSDEDILEFNLEAVGLYSDYTKTYIQVVKLMKELVEMQNESTFQYTSSTFIVVDGALLRNSAFRYQQGMINGIYLSDLLAQQEQLDTNQSLYISPNGVEVVTDRTEIDSQLRVEKGILGVITAALMVTAEVAIIVTTWGTTGIPMAFLIVATITAAGSLIYSSFNLIENVSNIIYGVQGNVESDAINYLKDGLSYIFGSEEAGEIAYNVWGIANTVIAALTMPIAKTIISGLWFGQTFGQITLRVIQFVGVRVAEAAITVAGSSIIGLAAGQVTELITNNEIAAAYVKDFTTILAGIAIGIGIGVAEKVFDFSGYTKTENMLHIKKYCTDHGYKNVYDCVRDKGNDVGAMLKDIAADDILNHGGDPKKYGLDPSNPDDKAIIDFLFENGRFPSFNKGDPIQCEFAHAVDVKIIVQAILDGKITLEQGLAFAGNPLNGMLTSHDFHLNVCHNGNFNNATISDIIIAHRPETESTILYILSILGV